MDVLYAGRRRSYTQLTATAIYVVFFSFVHSSIVIEASGKKITHGKSNFIVYLQEYKNSKACISENSFLFDVACCISVWSKRFIYFSWKLSISWSRRMNFSNFNVKRVRWSLQHEDIIDRQSNAFREIAKKSNFLRETIVSLNHVGLTCVLKNSRPLSPSRFFPSPLSRALVELSEPSMKYRTRYFLTDKL